MTLANSGVSSPADIVGIIFGILVLVAGALAVARASYIGAQLDGLRGDRDDQAKRIDRQDEEIKRQDEEIKKLDIELGKERNARQVLERVVTGKEQLDALTDLVRQHDLNMAAQGEAVITLLQELRPR